MATHNKPFHTLRSGGMKAAIWLNDEITGPFLSMTFSRSFKDRAGAWRNANSFTFSDLEALMNLTLDAKEWIASRDAIPRLGAELPAHVTSRAACGSMSIPADVLRWSWDMPS